MQTDFNMDLVSEDDRFLAAMAHLSVLLSLFIGPFSSLVPAIIWYRERSKREASSAFILFHAAQSAIYQSIIATLLVIAAVISFFLCIFFIGFFLLPLVLILGILFLVYGCFLGMKTWQGENMKYYLIGEELARRIPR